MSIVNEALKKAAKEDAPKSSREKHRSGFSVRSFSIQALFFRGLPVLFLVLLLAVAFTQQDRLLHWVSQVRLTASKVLKSSTAKNSTNVQPASPQTGPSAPSVTETNTGNIAASGGGETERLLNSGVRFFQEKKFKEAEQEFLKVVALQPANALAHNNLGLALKAQDRFADAEVEYLAALQNNPKYPEAFNNLGLLYEQQGRVQEAIQQYRKAIEVSPDYPEAHFNYAQVLERAGYIEEARRHYQVFLAADSIPSDLRLRVQQHLNSLP